MESIFKKVFASLSVAGIMFLSIGTAFAGTFGDVVPEDWYFTAVEELAVDGVFDANDQFRPHDLVNRAELVKIAVLAIDGMRYFDAPETPTFKDVSPDAWYYDYVEAAVSFGIIHGYTDVHGNPTGFFGPGDNVTRAQAAKILVEAFAYPTRLEPPSPFTDVIRQNWFYEYVTTAYNHQILSGYGNGYYGPYDSVTRAQMAKMTHQGMRDAEIRFASK